VGAAARLSRIRARGGVVATGSREDARGAAATVKNTVTRASAAELFGAVTGEGFDG